jgi:uncharacterized protein
LVEQALLFIVLGIFLGAFGTLVGTGGGFILVPVLLWLYPEQHPVFITSISLAVVSVNSLSGVLAYKRMQRVDFRSGTVFALATAPGAVLGALSTAYVPRDAFDFFIGVLLISACFLLIARTRRQQKQAITDTSPVMTIGQWQTPPKTLVIGSLLSFTIGFFSSMLGISGGIFQVPVMVYGLGFPVHIAVATSEFVLALKGLAATSVHIVSGAILQGLRQILVLSVGVAVGAQVGAWLSNHVKGEWIMQALALSIGAIGLRFLVTSLVLP